MFDEALRFLDSHNGSMEYNMEILPDSDGVIDKEYPNDNCQSKFKVNGEDWSNLISTMPCPVLSVNRMRSLIYGGQQNSSISFKSRLRRA